MKNTICVISVALILGCTTTQQTVAFNTISSVEQAGTAAVNAYFSLVVQGKVPTNDVPKVAQAYNTLQASVVFASTTLQAGTNALAPASLQAELTQLMAVITLAEGGH